MSSNRTKSSVKVWQSLVHSNSEEDVHKFYGNWARTVRTNSLSLLCPPTLACSVDGTLPV